MCYDTPLGMVEISGLISPVGGDPCSEIGTVSEKLNRNFLEHIHCMAFFYFMHQCCMSHDSMIDLVPKTVLKSARTTYKCIKVEHKIL